MQPRWGVTKDPLFFQGDGRMGALDSSSILYLSILNCELFRSQSEIKVKFKSIWMETLLLETLTPSFKSAKAFAYRPAWYLSTVTSILQQLNRSAKTVDQISNIAHLSNSQSQPPSMRSVE